MADLELLVMVENIKHRKVIRRLARGRIPWRSKTLTFVFLVIMNTAGALPDIIKIGGLFDVTDNLKGETGRQETAFRYAVERINQNRDILPRSRLSAQIEKIPPQDSFHASKQVCHLLRSGVAALFGPESGTTSTHIQSICDAMEIPHIETRWDYMLRRDDYSINLYPNPKVISKAYVNLIESFGWNSFTILYQDNQGLVRLQELLKAPTQSDIKIVVRQLSFKDDKNKDLLKEIKQSGEIHLVLDCDFDKVHTVLKDAQAVGMMTAYHNYLITNMDLHLVDLEEFKYAGTNLTAFRMVDPENEEVKETLRTWNLKDRFPGRYFGGGSILKEPSRGNESTLKTETALIYDAVHLFSKALHDLDQSQVINTKPLSCDGQETWQHGNSLVNFMKLIEMRGLTGNLKFDQHGLRTDFELDIIELKRDGLVKVGTWTETGGVNMTRNFTETYTEIVESLQNKTLIVTTIMSPPYSMVTQSEERLTGNDAFEGFAIDLIAEIAEILKFNYTFKWVDDGAYGFRNKETGEWNGLMGELLAQKADLAITDLTITYEREQAVDFSMPFMNLGISILYKKPQKKPPDLFSFLSPLSLDVWIYTATAYLGVSILLFILARFSPYEWDNPHPCTEEAEVLVNEFSLCNSMWFTIGSLMQQGSDISPKAISTRMVAGMWWFFTLIMISSYTANLAAFLTVERMESPIESAEDLAKQTKIKYGCLESGSTRAFFRDSKIPTYARMTSFMESQKPKVFTGSNAEGVQKVLESPGHFAFLMESNSIHYQIERNCELTQIGGLLDSKGYGIAFTPGSPYRIPISSAILQLQEAGRLHILKNRWWKERRGGGQCKEELKKMANELSLDNVGGIFVVLLAGMGIACSIAVIEYIWKSRRLEKKINIRHSDLVKKAIVQTNTNMFYINRNSLDINGRGTIHTDHCHDQAEDWTNTIKSPEYHLVGPGQKLLLKAQHSTDTHDSLCATPENSRSVMVMSNSSIPDITKRKAPDFQSERTQQSRTPDITDICGGDPYGPMNGRNLRGVARQENLEDEYSEHDSYFIAPATCSRNSTPRQRLKNKNDSLERQSDSCSQVNPTYHAYCDIHCQCKHSRQNTLRRSVHNMDMS